MILTATFIGQDGSMGYKKGQQYTFQFRDMSPTNLWVIPQNGEAQNCPYQSIGSFLRNWSNVSMVERKNVS